MMIKILLADDQCLILEGIKEILKHEPEIEIVGTAQDGQSAIAQVKKLQPDIVLIDIEMPKMNGIIATKHICKYMPDTRVIVLTSHKNQNYLAQALQAGASGYLFKDSLIEDLKQVIHSLGKAYPESETKLLTQAVHKTQTAKIIKYQKKAAYVQKYRQNIYIPAPNHRSKRSLSLNSSNTSPGAGISKASLAPILYASTDNEVFMSDWTTQPNLGIHNSPKLAQRKYWKRIAWLIIALASLLLSIIVF
ncbi:MAG: response regulator transcription factor [Pleurocapsa sp.]